MEVIWSKRAKQDYLNVLEYLHKNWGIKEVRGFVSKHNSLFYQVKYRKKQIILLTFLDNRQNPEKLNY